MQVKHFIMNKITFLSYILAALLLSNCNSNQGSGGHTHDVVGGSATHAPHDQETTVLSYTLFAHDYELFVEFPPLVVGQTSPFAVHFTNLANYTPVSEGKVTVSIIKAGKGLRNTVDAPSSPGIFRPALQPKEAGIYRLLFELENKKGKEIFEIQEIEVFANTDAFEASVIESGSGDEIIFLKEQAWKTDFKTQEVSEKYFHSVISTSAKVKIQPRSEIVLNAPFTGQVSLVVMPGDAVQKGQILAIITGAGVENNLSVKLSEYRFAYEKSIADYIRTKPLANKDLISEKDFLNIKSLYQQDSLRYFQIAKHISRNGLNVKAPFAGFISEIFIENGTYQETGLPILKVSNKNQVLIEAYVNQSDFQLVGGIFDAHFKLPSENLTITLAQLDGKIKRTIAQVNSGSSKIPVLFTVANDDLLFPGMYLEALIMTDPKENALTVPLSAIIEEQGQYFVFVQSGGESFLKRQIQLANNDGLYVEIISGVQKGERIVTRGAYQIKLAAMAGDLPLHGHTH